MKKKNVRIAIIDSGFDEKNCKINYPIISRYNVERECVNEEIEDLCGHGTGIVKILDDILCVKVEYVIIKILNENCKCSIEQLNKSIEIAIKEKVDLINMSLGTGYSECIQELQSLCEYAFSKNIIFITTCPNNTYSVCYPYKFGNSVKVVANARILNDDIYYKKGIFYAKGVNHIIPWKDGKYIYSSSNSFSTPFVTAKIAQKIFDEDFKAENIINEMIYQSKSLDDLSDVIIKQEDAIDKKFNHLIVNIIEGKLHKKIENKRLSLQGMTPQLSIEILDEIERRTLMDIKHSMFNYIDFEYVENLSNKILQIL